jgi:hypothetical protein
MTSALATNAIVPKNIDTVFHLKATRNGAPLNKQVPRTYQIYTGTGNQTIQYDGSNEIIINGPTLTGPLIIQFGPIANIRNAIGRKLNIIIVSPIFQTITLNSSPAFMKINGTNLTQLSHVIPADNISKAISVFFHSVNVINVDYGASAASVVPSNFPNVSNVGTGVDLYRDTTGTTLNFRRLNPDYYTILTQNPDEIQVQNVTPRTLPSRVLAPYATFVTPTVVPIYTPKDYNYTVDIESNQFFIEGSASPITTSISATGYSTVDFAYSPPPEYIFPYTFNLVFTSTDDHDVKHYAPVTIVPDLKNGIRSLSYMGHDGTNQLKMYFQSVNPAGVPKVALDQTGNSINIGVVSTCLAMDMLRSIIYYASTASTIINFKQTGNGSSATLRDVSLMTRWTAGSLITDMDYHEKSGCLYVLPNNPVGRLAILPILSNTSVVVFVRSPIVLPLSLPAGSVPLSIAVHPDTRQILIAYRPLVGNIVIQLFDPDLVASLISFTTTFATGSVSMCFTTQGTLLIQWSGDNRLYTIGNNNSFGEPLSGVYVLPGYLTSMTRNGFGYTNV